MTSWALGAPNVRAWGLIVTVCRAPQLPAVRDAVPLGPVSAGPSSKTVRLVVLAVVVGADDHRAGHPHPVMEHADVVVGAGLREGHRERVTADVGDPERRRDRNADGLGA